MTGNKSATANFGTIAQLDTPSGLQDSWDNTFSWTGLTGATWYLLDVVQTSTGNTVLLQWYTAIDAGCDSDLSCVVSPAGTVFLSPGEYKWRIVDWGDYGYGLWTAFMDFELADNCYSLTTDVDPLGSGTVSVDLGENCPDGGYTYGTVVQLTAMPNPGYKFTSWSGNASGTSETTSLTMTGNKSVTANFGAIAQLDTPSGTQNSWDNTFSWTGLTGATWYLLEVQTSTGDPVLLQWYTAIEAGCDSDLSCAVSPAETVFLSPGDYKWRILDWGDYGYGLWTAFMDFELADTCYSLTTDVDPLGSGTVSVDLGENCPDGGYTYGTVVQLTAMPNPGYKFTNWSGNASGTAETTSLTMTGNKSVTANFGATALLDTPSGTQNSWDNTFSWTGLTGATWYLLEVQTSNGDPVLLQWYSAIEAGCDSDLSCAVSPAETVFLPHGDYQWRIRGLG